MIRSIIAAVALAAAIGPAAAWVEPSQSYRDGVAALDGLAVGDRFKLDAGDAEDGASCVVTARTGYSVTAQCRGRGTRTVTVTRVLVYDKSRTWVRPQACHGEALFAFCPNG